ncbi:thialysine N-epsilon-acetyltransferase-like [Diadema setosum]|uniref:thialysine N-epsilon-acetyltransferase-like n=1 Tax=Diadema setosum TaxID=31175 RepID=UPI003B3A3D0D
MREYVVRRARVDDCAKLMPLIREFAVHEKAPPPTISTEDIREDTFGINACQTIYIAEYVTPSGDSGLADAPEGAGSRAKEIIGFTSVSYLYSVFTGRVGYLNALYLKEGHRGFRLGTALMKEITKECLSSGGKLLNWDVLGWHDDTKRFYSKIGATNLSETKQWEYMQLQRDDLQKFAYDTELRCPPGVSITFNPD